MILKTLFIALSFLSIHSNRGTANDLYPDLPMQITALDLALQFDQNLNIFTSKAVYSMRVNRDDVFMFSMAHTDLTIRSVRIDGKEVPVQINKDSLRIGLRESFPKNAEFELHIDYQGTVKEAFFKTSTNILWTSGLKSDIRKLLPVIDHPRITFRSIIRAVHPNEYHFVSNGSFISRSRLNETQTTTLFENRSLLPISGLRFVLGQIEVKESQIGALPIRLYTSKSDQNMDRLDRFKDLINVEIIRLSSAIRYPYPFDALHVVFLPESYGQEWGDGAGIGYIFEDYGFLEEQLKLIVSSQWLRQNLYSVDPDVEEYVTTYTQILAQTTNVDFLNPSKVLQHNYSIIDRLSPFIRRQNLYYSNFKIADIENLLKTQRRLLTRSDLDEVRYKDQWYFRPLPLQGMDTSSLGYRANLSVSKPGFIAKLLRTEVPGEIQLQFEAFGAHQYSVYDVDIISYYEGDSTKQALRVSSVDSIFTVDLGPTVQNVILRFRNDHNLDIVEEKPFGYWLYQYRNSRESHLKREAARSLAGFVSNEDVGLLLRDEIIRKETDAYLGMIFQLWSLDTLNPSVDLDKWLYEELETKDRIRLYQLVSEQYTIEQLSTLALDFLNRTNSWDIHIQLIKKVFKELDPKEAIRFSEPYLSSKYPYELRSVVLREMSQHDQSPKNWMNRLPELVMDQDPRIRMLALKNSSFLSDEQKNLLFKDRQSKERDLRILSYLSSSND